MAKLNVPTAPIFTHEGGKAQHINPELQLRRLVCACLLWEKTCYEDGESVADRIIKIIPLVKPEKVAALAIEARTEFKLRHVPLLLVREMARLSTHKSFVAETLAEVIQRPDELAEFLAIYWKDGRQPLSTQVKKGLAKAFTKFNTYQLAKYNRGGAIKLRDVLFLCHAKGKDAEQQLILNQLVDNTLPIPDTWETQLSAGNDKKTVWESLIAKRELGGLALLRNLRNMEQSGVSENCVKEALLSMKVDRILPYRFIAAAKYAPQWEPWIETALLKCLKTQAPLLGSTVILLDVSGSMENQVSNKSDITRLDAACGMAILLRQICEHVRIYTFSTELVLIPPREGFALRDAIISSQAHSGTLLGLAVQSIYAPKDFHVRETKFGYSNTVSIKYDGQALSPNRLIVFTDEQSADKVPSPQGKGYMINVSTNKNGVGYSAWTHIDGWSESVIKYIQEVERILR